MKILLICDTFFPASNSAANQLYDLAIQLDLYGHELIIMTPLLNNSIYLDNLQLKKSKIKISFVKMPLNKDVSLFKRVINEILIPPRFLIHYYTKKINKENVNAIIWYSPTIFFGLFVKFIKKNRKTYLILRDIFPKWAFEAGVIKSKIVYNFFKKIELLQYEVADTIGVQSKGNITHFEGTKFLNKVKILNNWVLHDFLPQKSKIIKNRVKFIFIGNIGVAQDISAIMQIIKYLLLDEKFEITFLGRGTMYNLLKDTYKTRKKNIYFLNEMPNNMIPKLLDEYHIGIISLDQSISSNNIPGKFITYTTYGLPVIAYTRPKGDLANYITDYNLGFSFNNFDNFNIKIENLINNFDLLSRNCLEFSKNNFDVKKITNQIISCLE